jgi:CBS domain-containing protein
VPTIDPVAYLRGISPFHALPAALFDAVAGKLEVGFFEKGTRLGRVGGEPLAHLYVIRKGAVHLGRDGQTLQVLEEGEAFGYTSLITGKATLDVYVDEDLLAYRIPAEVFRLLLADASFAGHFAGQLSERLKASLEHSPVATFQPDLAMPVGRLLRGPAVWVAPETTVAEAARVMSAAGISSVLVRSEPPGIVTDRDFRNRVLAGGLGSDVPVSRVFSRPLLTVAAETPIYQVWTELLDARVHHLPVTRDGTVVGVLTATDLLRSTAQGPVAVLRGVEGLESRAGLGGYATRVTEMVAALLAGGLDPMAIAGLVARLNDALLRRLLRWAVADLGAPPAPFAWIAFGSEGRMEQTLLTDQDNALVYADEGGDHREWFQAFAALVDGDLERAGFPPCPGGYMAVSWHGTLTEWTQRFTGWTDVPTPQALLVASIFFDFRKVGGDLDLEPLERVVVAAAGKPVFLRLLARDALQGRPPPQLLLRLRGSSSTVDLKASGIRPIVSLARRYALQAGSRARSTIERLQAARRAGLLDEDDLATMTEAYRFLLGLRLRLQLGMTAAGRPLTSTIALSSLSAIERSRVKDAFGAIRAWQDAAADQFHVDF